MAQNNGTIPKTVTNGSNIQLNQVYFIIGFFE